MGSDLPRPVIVPSELDTGMLRHIEAGVASVTMDLTRLVQRFPSEKVATIRWKVRTRDGAFLMIAKAWMGPFKGRRIRVQRHKIYSDGHIGARIIILDRRNGRPLRAFW